MIKAEKNMVSFNGDKNEVLTDLTLITSALHQWLIGEYGNKEKAEFMIKKTIDLGLKDDEEIHKEAMEAVEIVDSFIDKLFGRMCM